MLIADVQRAAWAHQAARGDPELERAAQADLDEFADRLETHWTPTHTDSLQVTQAISALPFIAQGARSGVIWDLVIFWDEAERDLWRCNPWCWTPGRLLPAPEECGGAKFVFPVSDND